MIAVARIFLSLLCVSLCQTAMAETPLDQPRNPPGNRPTTAAVDAWKDRKFGMFIHFGVYSKLGGVWQGKPVRNGYSEQIMSHAPISKTDYENVARTFDPEKFDADAIVRLAQAAGMKFIVITAKHHDGFNMFATKLSRYNIRDYTPFHRDVVAELAAACRQFDMKFGVYYSSIDWHYPGATGYALDNDRNDNVVPKAHEDYSAGQLRELASNYGPLSEIWFDMGKPTPAQSKRFADTVHGLQPDCMVSGRVFNYQGDFTVMGDNSIAPFVIDEPWQTPASIYTDTWGYRSWEDRKSVAAKTRELIHQLVQVVSRGGNYILNIGPQGDGSVVPFEATVLNGIGRWTHANAEAIYGSYPQPFRNLDFGYATQKPGRLYLFIEHTPANGRLDLPGLENKLKSAYYLQDPKRSSLKVVNEGDTKAVELSKNPNVEMPVVVVEYADALAVTPKLQAPDAAGIFHLTAKSAERFYNYNGYGYEDPPTIYKEQWAIPLLAGATHGHATITYSGADSQNPRLDLLAGSAHETVALSNGKASVEFALPAQSRFIWVKITPPEPFVKGTKLAAQINEVQVTMR